VFETNALVCLPVMRRHVNATRKRESELRVQPKEGSWKSEKPEEAGGKKHLLNQALNRLESCSVQLTNKLGPINRPLFIQV
jgi:hypothetical protein